MGLEFEGGNHPKVPTASANGPEKILVLASIHSYKTSICQNHFGLQQIIYGKSIFSGKVTDAPTKGKSANTRSGNNSRRYGKAEGVSGLVHFPPDIPASHFYGIIGGINFYKFYP